MHKCDKFEVETATPKTPFTVFKALTNTYNSHIIPWNYEEKKGSENGKDSQSRCDPKHKSIGSNRCAR